MDWNINSKVFYLIVFLLIKLNGSSQNCTGFEKKCEQPDSSFSISSSSQSISIAKGETKTISIMAYKCSENFISVCGESDIGIIQFKILTADKREELYDNSDDSFVQVIDLRVDVTAKIIIQISLPKANFLNKEEKCIGLFIANKKISWY